MSGGIYRKRSQQRHRVRLPVALLAAPTASASLSGSASYSYAASGQLEVLVELAGSASYSYAASGQLEVLVALAGSASYPYSASGTLETFIELAGSASYSYAASGQLEVLVELAGSASYAYEASGTLVTATTRSLSGSVVYPYAATGALSAPRLLPPGYGGGGGKPRRVQLAEWLAEHRAKTAEKLPVRRSRTEDPSPEPPQLEGVVFGRATISYAARGVVRVEQGQRQLGGTCVYPRPLVEGRIRRTLDIVQEDLQDLTDLLYAWLTT